MDRRQKIGLQQLLHQITSVSRSDFLTMLVYSQLNYSLLKMAFNIVKYCDWDHFVIFTDSLSSLQALDSNNCDHPFIQDILKLLMIVCQ